jgi:hypothetical protein
MSFSHRHISGYGSQNTGNTLGNRSCIRQSRTFRRLESGNAMKGILGHGNLSWDYSRKEGAYRGQAVYDADIGFNGALTCATQDRDVGTGAVGRVARTPGADDASRGPPKASKQRFARERAGFHAPDTSERTHRQRNIGFHSKAGRAPLREAARALAAEPKAQAHAHPRRSRPRRPSGPVVACFRGRQADTVSHGTAAADDASRWKTTSSAYGSGQ